MYTNKYIIILFFSSICVFSVKKTASEAVINVFMKKGGKRAVFARNFRCFKNKQDGFRDSPKNGVDTPHLAPLTSCVGDGYRQNASFVRILKRRGFIFIFKPSETRDRFISFIHDFFCFTRSI